MIRGLIDSKGRSAVPEGIIDTSEGADKVQLSPEVQARLDKLFAESDLDKVKAKYKLELSCNQRSLWKPYSGIITAWTNGGFAHGGGDEAVYFCPNPVERDGSTKTCSRPLELRWINKKAAVCPHCKSFIKPSDLCGQIGFKLTNQNWAIVLTKIWNILGADADIRLGELHGTLRKNTEAVLNKSSLSAGDKLDDTRNRREWAVYPLRNLIQDISTGASPEARIRAFLDS